jgi:4-amino-4-deoxy-L-arabinose transferase-like glycosyltransferase
LLTPILIPLLVSVTVKPVLEPRYVTVSIPALALLGGAIASELAGVGRPLAMLGAMMAAQGYGDWAYFARVEKEDWRGATQAILAVAAPGDVAVFYAPYVRRPYDYYIDRFGRPATAPLVLYPARSYSEFTPGDRAVLSLSEAIARASHAPRTWLVLSHAEPDAACRRELDAVLRSVYATVEDHEFARVDVRLYSNRGRDVRPPGDTGTAIARPMGPIVQCPQQ